MSLITPSEPVEAVPEGTSPAPPRDRSRRPLSAALVTAIAVIAALVAVIPWPGGGDDAATTEPSTTVTTAVPTTAPPTTAEPTTAPPTTATPTTAPPAVDTATAVFPSGPGAARYDDPVAAARDFATDFVGFTDLVVGPFRAGDARSGEVVIRANPNGPATTVMLRRLGAGGSWWVIGAATENISVSSPETGEDIASPVTVTGSALAWEGFVAVEIRHDGTREPLGTGVVTGGGDVMRPFSGDIAFGSPTQPYGALVLVSHSGENGQVVQASVQRVAFDR
ncbi:MAG TPA: Gmad2 immunoglobulin-like domain-containing protein [Acidimicrobiales bacterium]